MLSHGEGKQILEVAKKVDSALLILCEVLFKIRSFSKSYYCVVPELDGFGMYVKLIVHFTKHYE